MKLRRSDDLRTKPRSALGVWLIASTCLAGSFLPAGRAAETDQKQAAGSVSYFKDIRPVLRDHCAGCHQPAVKQGELTLTTYEGFLEGGAKGKVISPGHPDQSLVIAYLTGVQKPQM